LNKAKISGLTGVAENEKAWWVWIS